MGVFVERDRSWVWEATRVEQGMRTEGHTAEQQQGVSVVYKQQDTGGGNRQA
jgi:hypothetical protein